MRSFQTAFPPPLLETYQKGVMAYTYKGVRCLKSPVDMALYMKLLWDLKPNLVLEIGSHSGGSALLLADLLSCFGLETPVISIDLKIPEGVQDDRVRFLEGNIEQLEEVIAVHDLARYSHPWFVTEDSAHSYSGCMTALRVFRDLMKPGDVLAVEDGILDELGLSARYDGGPNRAIADFLEAHPDEFRIMTELCDAFGPNLTYNPNGYLCKL